MFEGDDTVLGVKLNEKVIGVIYRLDHGKPDEPRRWGGTAQICDLEEFPTIRDTLEHIRRTYEPEPAD